MIEAIVVGTITGAIASGASVLYATLGEILGQRAGIVNLGIEGVMLVGASVSFATTATTGDPLAGVLAGMLTAAVFNLVLGLLAVTRRANPLASGLALWLLGAGASTLIGLDFTGRHVAGLPDVELPLVASLPPIYRQIFRQDPLVYLMVPIAIAMWWTLRRTRWGLRLRAVGEDRLAAYAAGIRTSLVQYEALFIAGALSGLAGVQLALAYTKTWQEGMTAYRGFVVLAIVIFSLWHPLRAIVGALLFGGAISLGLELQVMGAPISPFVLNMLPYLITFAVVLVWGRPKWFTVPMGLREVFEGTAK
jgi:general nucleoside transport system permease protein